MCCNQNEWDKLKHVLTSKTQYIAQEGK